MELAPLLWSYLATIVGSITLTTISTLGFIKEFAKKGYKLNLERMNEISINEFVSYSPKVLLLIPGVNLAFPFLTQNTLYKNYERLKKLGLIIPLSKEEKLAIGDNPKLRNIMDITAGYSTEKCGTLIYEDQNHQKNTIEFIDENGTLLIEDVNGPEIEQKTKMEQRGILLSQLEELNTLRYLYLKKEIEEAIQQGYEQIDFTQIYPEDIEAIAKLIFNYKTQIQINIQFYDGVDSKTEISMLQDLSEQLQELSELEEKMTEEQKKLIK